MQLASMIMGFMADIRIARMLSFIVCTCSTQCTWNMWCESRRRDPMFRVAHSWGVITLATTGLSLSGGGGGGDTKGLLYTGMDPPLDTGSTARSTLLY